MQHVIVLPDLGQTTSEARIVRWLKREGEHVRRGEFVITVETDKVNMDVESFESGYLRRALVAEGEMATALAPIAILTDSADEPYMLPAQEHPTTAAIQPIPEPQELRAPTASERVSAAPAARALAKELSVDLSEVPGTGANGLITRSDVERFAKERQRK